MIAQVAAALVFFAGDGVDPSAAQATSGAVKAKLGAVTADLSAEHRALLTPKLFVDFAAPPPAFLPTALAESWKRGSDACAKHTGPTGPELPPPARASAAAVARSCQEALGLAMWDELLDAKQIGRVVEVELRAERGGALEIAAALHQPGVKRHVMKVGHVSAERAAAEAVKVLDALLAGSGAEAPARRHPLPSVGVPALDAVSFGEPKPATIPAKCAALPARLEVFPLGKVTRQIEAAYRTVPANKRTGKPLRCDLVLYPGYEPAGEPIAQARLACPPAQLRAAEPVKDGARLVARLVDQAVAALCTP